ncbi:antitoxin [bacterium]|nr:antitoxin [bacterium]
MRTTVDIDDDILQAAKSLARSRRVSLGRALSQMARKGLQPSPALADDQLFPLFPCRPSDPPVTAEQVKEALEEW